MNSKAHYFSQTTHVEQLFESEQESEEQMWHNKDEIFNKHLNALGAPFQTLNM